MGFSLILCYYPKPETPKSKRYFFKWKNTDFINVVSKELLKSSHGTIILNILNSSVFSSTFTFCFLFSLSFSFVHVWHIGVLLGMVVMVAYFVLVLVAYYVFLSNLYWYYHWYWNIMFGILVGGWRVAHQSGAPIIGSSLCDNLHLTLLLIPNNLVIMALQCVSQCVT